MKRLFSFVRAILLITVCVAAGAAGNYLVRSQSTPAEPESDLSANALPPAAHQGDRRAGAMRTATASQLPGLPHPAPQVSEKEPEETPAAATESEVATQAVANSLIQGDLLLQEGRVTDAVRHFRHLLGDEESKSSLMAVRYRLALCAECLGEDDDALSEYQSVSQAIDDGELGELALLGQARVLSRQGNLSAAQELLRRWILQDNDTPELFRKTSEEGLYLLGAVTAKGALTQNAALWQPAGLAHPRWAFEPSEFLPESQSAEMASPETATSAIEFGVTHQLAEAGPSSTYFHGTLPRMSVSRVIQQFCQTGGWELEWTALAEKAVRAHTVQLNFTEKTADVLFDLLLAPLNASWSFDAGRVLIVADSELTEDVLQTQRLARSERLLFAALLTTPNHQHAPATYLLLGALAFEQGDLSTARRHFEHILQNYPRSSVDAEAWFNAAKINMAEGNLTRSRQALLGAIDSGRGHALEPIALLISGELELLFDEPENAIRPLMRAVTLAGDSDVRSRSLLTLASAHLIAKRPEGANIALMEDRRLLQHEEYADQAAFFASLARYRAATTPEKKERDGRALVSALSHIESASPNGLWSKLLIAEAYRDVGLAELALSILERATATAIASPLRTRLQFMLAEGLLDRRDNAAAEKTLEELANNENAQSASRAMLMLAECAIKRGDDDGAEQTCRRLLKQSLTEPQRINTLKMLGGIYAERGDRQRAILCYSGVTPQVGESADRAMLPKTPDQGVAPGPEAQP